MTDRETLFTYRLREAEETLADAGTMLTTGVSARSVVNRAYYAMFYAILALFIAENVEHKTSKHAGIISLFDRTMVHTGKLDRKYSRILHRLFDARQESDYKEFIQFTSEEAADCFRMAEEFLRAVKGLIEQDVSK
ncbi:MAG: HEPN domain-containing protein [Nitrospirota bacterium]